MQRFCPPTLLLWHLVSFDSVFIPCFSLFDDIIIGPKIRSRYEYVKYTLGLRKNTQNWFKHETFYYLFEFNVFRHELRETQFFSMVTFPSDSYHMRPPRQTTGLASVSSENRLASSKPKSQLIGFFSNSKILSASGYDVIHVPGPFPIWGFYCDISDYHIRPARVWTPALNVCT